MVLYASHPPPKVEGFMLGSPLLHTFNPQKIDFRDLLLADYETLVFRIIIILISVVIRRSILRILPPLIIELELLG